MSELSRYEALSSELALTSELIAKQFIELKQVSKELSSVDIASIKQAVTTYEEAIKSPITKELEDYVNQTLYFIKQSIEPKLNAIELTREKLESLNSGFNLIYSGYNLMKYRQMQQA